ncbi:hypothetical protein ABTM57_19495, partial [Acinetobacter baumannii]
LLGAGANVSVDEAYLRAREAIVHATHPLGNMLFTYLSSHSGITSAMRVPLDPDGIVRSVFVKQTRGIQK